MTTTRALPVLGDCTGDDIHNTLDDQATLFIQTDCQGGTQAYMMGTSYQPAGELNDFAGLPFSGTWEINVVDASPTEEGTFVLWALEGSVAEPEIDVVPMSIESSQIISTTTMHPLTITNSSDAVLRWDITSDVTWATVDTVSGTTDAAASSNLTVTFDSTGLELGTYTGTLSINSNDSDQPTLNVPVTLTVEEPPADIDVNPTSMEAMQGSDEVTTQTLMIENTGDADLDWMIEEEDTTTPALPDGNVNRLTPTAEVDPLLTAKYEAALLNSGDIVMDGSFEAGTPNSVWNETSTNFGTPLCDAGCGVAAANTGDWWAWFGGVPGAEDSTVDQDVTIPVGSNNLTFFFWIGAVSGANTDFMEVMIDGDQVWLATEADAAIYAAYTEVTVDISAYADGGTHNLMFHGAQPTGLSNFFLDDISISDDAVPADCAVPSDISWLTVSPTSGTTAPSMSSDVTVSFDSTGLMPGDYMGHLCIESNDDDESLMTVPLTLTVEAEPAIELVKTVGTDPAICAMTDVITVTEGSDVYYCYTVTNTGNITLPLHDLVDDQLGMLLDDFPFDLAPGASVSTVDAGAVISATLNDTTMNTATWTAFGDSLSAEASASATVNVNAIPVTAVEMAELATSTTSNLPLALAVAGMMLVLAGGYVVRRRRT
jgi:subtilisin-like proprotein convertase family protein